MDREKREKEMKKMGKEEKRKMEMKEEERQLRESDALERQKDRKNLEDGCIAQLEYASKIY